MQFNEFVTLYWNKTRRSGAPWTPAAIADDSGFSIDDVNMYLAWCKAQISPVPLTDKELIDKFAATMTVIRTPMGNYLGPKGADVEGSGPGTIGQMPTDAFWVQMQKLLGK
jgi:hypothetical protein